MRRPPEDEGARWLAQALRDLDDARYLAKGDRFSLACFVAQQAAEKALKAFLYHTGRESVWGHSVAELCRQAAELEPRFESLCMQGASLDRFYIPTRYPNGLPGGIPADAFLQKDADFALEVASSIIDAVEDVTSK